MIAAVNAAGGFIPPMMIFPRVNHKSYMIAGAPTGTIGAANLSGWTSAEIFVQWLTHFIECSRATVERPVLLMDNHESHMSIPALDLAKDNGVILLTFPPHCSHKLQPLDISVYGPLKRYYNDACNGWQMENPGHTLTIYNIGRLLGISFPKAFTTANITSGFRKPGISPFDRNVFSDDEFLGSYMTDRPAPSLSDDTLTPPATDSFATSEPTDPIPTTSRDSEAVALPIISPEHVRPHPKAGPRKTTGRGKGKSMAILTNTPVKDRLTKEAEERAAKKPKSKKVVKRKAILVEDSSSEDDNQHDELAKQLESDSDEPDSDLELLPDSSDITSSSLNVSDYVLVVVHGARSRKNYVAIVTSKSGDDIEVDFFIRVVGNHFMKPDQKDHATVAVKDVVLLLPPPAITGGTKRTAEKLSFAVDLSEYF